MTFLINHPLESDNAEPLKLDYHLEDRNLVLPPGLKPIWLLGDDLSFDEMKPKMVELTQDCGKVIAISKFKHMEYTKLCEEMNWIYANASDIIGSETNCLITFGIPFNQNLEEIISRARNKLIIITMDETR